MVSGINGNATGDFDHVLEPRAFHRSAASKLKQWAIGRLSLMCAMDPCRRPCGRSRSRAVLGLDWSTMSTRASVCDQPRSQMRAVVSMSCGGSMSAASCASSA